MERVEIVMLSASLMPKSIRAENRVPEVGALREKRQYD
jgi:hypothetical protein